MLNFAAICFILIKKTTSSPAHIFTILLLILLLSDWGFGAFRAQMFTFILIGLTLYGLLRYAESSSKFILILALTFPLWINIHGGAILSIILIGAYSIEELARKKIPYILILSALIMTALISINPWGLSFYIYLKNSLFMERPLISEWHPIWKTSEDYKLFIFIFFIVFFLAYWKKIDWKKNRGFACILLMMIMSIKSARFLPFFALTIAAFFPYYLKEVEFGSLLNRIWDKLNQNKLAVPLVFGVSILLTVLAFGQKPFTAKVPSEKIEHYPLIYPVGATKFLKDTNFRGNILTSFNTGSYVLWNLYPNSKVFIDSRYEVAYPETRMQESDKFYNKYEGWEKILNTYPHTVVLVAKTDKVYSELSNLDYLNLIFSDSIYSIFEIKPH